MTIAPHTYHISMDQFVYAPSQWETTLQCNVVSHWLGAYTKLPADTGIEAQWHWGTQTRQPLIRLLLYDVNRRYALAYHMRISICFLVRWLWWMIWKPLYSSIFHEHFLHNQQNKVAGTTNPPNFNLNLLLSGKFYSDDDCCVVMACQTICSESCWNNANCYFQVF